MNVINREKYLHISKRRNQGEEQEEEKIVEKKKIFCL